MYLRVVSVFLCPISACRVARRRCLSALCAPKVCRAAQGGICDPSRPASVRPSCTVADLIPLAYFGSGRSCITLYLAGTCEAQLVLRLAEHLPIVPYFL